VFAEEFCSIGRFWNGMKRKRGRIRIEREGREYRGREKHEGEKKMWQHLVN
jgi:hypothetical protein